MRLAKLLVQTFILTGYMAAPALAQEGVPSGRCAAQLTVFCSRNFEARGFDSPGECYNALYETNCRHEIPNPPEPVTCDEGMNCNWCTQPSRLGCF